MSKHNIKLRSIWFPALFAEGDEQEALTRLQRRRRARRATISKTIAGGVIIPSLLMASVVAAKPAETTYQDITATTISHETLGPEKPVKSPTLTAEVATPKTRSAAPKAARSAAAPDVATAPASPNAAGWIAVLDAYLAGSPMAGQGKAFYEAAAANGLDPRLSVAIAKTESGLGRAIPGGYNAYGMTAGTAPGHGRIGNWQAFASWEDAIWSNNTFIRSHWGSGAGPYNMRGYASSSTWSQHIAGAMSAITPPIQ